MARPQDLPLDERVHQHPGMNAWYMGHLPDSQFALPYMDANMLHRYISESPFFDWTSKNGLEISHSKTDIFAWQTSHDKAAFEELMGRRSGLEFMFVEGRNMEFDAEGRAKDGGVWVVRKQERTKGVEKGGRDRVETLGTYYLIGENMYQAPAVGDVVGMRLLTAANALSNLFSEASTLPSWSPTTGHTYLPPTTSASKPTVTGGSVASTPAPSHSREGSLAPTSARPDPTTTSTSTSLATSAATSTSLLATSLKSSFQHSTDYIDENPLIGVPGNLSFTSSTTAAKKRIADAEAAAQRAKEAKEVKREAISRVGTPAVMTSKPPSPPAVMTEGRVKKEKKGGKRRKSRMVGGTPAASPTA